MIVKILNKCVFFTVVTLFAIHFGIKAQSLQADGNVRFEVISTAQGLSQSSVFSLAQDKKGFIWMGTRDGLNRYDGYDFLSFRNNPQDTNSLSNNEITKVFVNKQGNLWIGTRGGGLNYYDQAVNKFTRYANLNYDNFVRDIFEADDSTLWVGSSEGLLKFASAKGNRFRYTNVSATALFKFKSQSITKTKLNQSVISVNKLTNNKLLIGSQYGLFIYEIARNQFHKVNLGESDTTIVNCSMVNSDGSVWVGTFNGLVKLLPKKSDEYDFDLEFYNTRQKGSHHLFGNRIETMTRDCFGNIWMGIHGGGLIQFEINGKISTFVNDESDNQSLPDNIVNSLMMDNSGVLWIGTESQGCCKLDLYRKKFIHIRNISNKISSLNSNSVTAIAGSGNGVIWVGTAVKGVDKLTYANDGSYKIDHFEKIPIILGQTSSEVFSMYEDREGVLWIGTGSNSITRYKQGEGFRSFPINGYVFSIHQDQTGSLWIGTWGEGLGLLNRNTGSVMRLTNVPENPQSLSSDKVLAIFDDKWGNLWVGTKAGGVNVIPLSKVKQGKNEFLSFKHSHALPKGVVHNDIYCIMQDSRDNIWLGTGGGLCRVVWADAQHSLKNIQFESYVEKDGLPNEMIHGIVEDKQGNLWLSTNNGLSMFNPKSKEFVNYNVNDGLQANEFRSNSYWVDKQGNMFFGGVNGLTTFNPSNLKSNPCSANVLITRFRVANHEIKPGTEINGRRILEYDITQTKDIKLTYRDKEFTFDFAAMHYANPQRIRYAYRLVGFNDSWQIIENGNRSVTYTNLDDGKYVFQLKATNNDGKWNEKPLEVNITIQPPIWRRPWFYLIYVVIIAFLLYVFQKYSLIAVKEKNRIALERLEHKKQLELSQAKMRFFTNVSHEIRTPLTLISDPLNQVISNGEVDENSRKSLSLISNNVNRLLNMVNQLLQLRNIDLGSVKLKISEVPFVPFIKEILGHFEQQSSLKQITFTFTNELDDRPLFFDREMISTVFYNLLSNAFKFTPEKGSITVKVFKPNKPAGKLFVSGIKDWFTTHNNDIEWVVVEISDTGRGIPHKELKNIFHRFYQVTDPESPQFAGSGIGLSLVEEYVSLHKGQVKVSSKAGKGSRFTVLLRAGSQHFKQGQFVLEDENEENLKPSRKETLIEGSALESDKLLAKDSKDFTILLIEDDRDLAGYIETYFAKKYRIKVAYDGASGLKLAESAIPDIIISDVMMPEMDGLQLCKLLKTNIETSHIPIILLTARAAEENVMEGYEQGADIYMPKPFNIEILAKQVKMLLESRIKLRQKFSQQLVFEPTDVTITSTDERFLKQLMEVTDTHLTDSEFDVTKLVDSMNMSHAVILRKVKALTEMSLVDFIKEQRLKKAALILQKGKISIAEVGYMVGFSDPKYFSKCFIKKFGKTPSEYCNEFQLDKTAQGD